MLILRFQQSVVVWNRKKNNWINVDIKILKVEGSEDSGELKKIE